MREGVAGNNYTAVAVYYYDCSARAGVTRTGRLGDAEQLGKHLQDDEKFYISMEIFFFLFSTFSFFLSPLIFFFLWSTNAAL
jgi:hypothetical protein